MKQRRGTGERHRGSLSRQGLLIHEDPERPTDRPRAGACGTPADHTPSHDELHLPLTFAFERNDLRAQSGGKKSTEEPASGKAPIARMENVGGQVIGSAECSDASDEQAPRKAARDGDQPAFSLYGQGTADDLLLPHIPCIPAWICIPLRPDTIRPIGDDTVYDSLLLTRSGMKMITSPRRSSSTRQGTNTIRSPGRKRGRILPPR